MNQITELTMWGVYDAGKPNMERVVLYVEQETEMGNFALLTGLRSNNGGGIPLQDNFFWFGNAVLKRGDWVFVYTAPGTPQKSPLPGSENFIHTLHMGKKNTVFNSTVLTPMLVRMDGLQMPTVMPLLAAGQE